MVEQIVQILKDWFSEPVVLVSLSLIIIQKRFSLVRLDPMTYYSDHVPVEIDPIKILLINLVVIVISMLMLLIPSGTISKIKPNSSFKLT